MSEKLTPKQARFVQEYLVDLNATQAAIRAGYSEHTAKSIGQENLTKPAVAAAVAEAQAKLSEKTEITQEWVLGNLKTITERCMQVEPVFDRRGRPVLVETPEGEMAPAYVFNASGATRAVELLGKHIGMFSDKLELSGRLGLTHEDALKQLADDEPAQT